MLSSESLRSPAVSRSNSQASVDSASVGDFWQETDSVKENSMGGREEQVPVEVKPVDGKVLHLLSCVLSLYACPLLLCWQVGIILLVV